MTTPKKPAPRLPGRALDAVTLPLGDTKTYFAREVTFLPFDENGFGGLVIRQWLHSFRRGTGRRGYEADLYQVFEQPPPVGVMAREFVLLNILDSSQELPYRVLIGRDHSCTCTAGRCRVPGYEGFDGCKHRCSLRALIESGYLDDIDTDDVGESRYEDEPGEPTVYEPEVAHAG